MGPDRIRLCRGAVAGLFLSIIYASAVSTGSGQELIEPGTRFSKALLDRVITRTVMLEETPVEPPKSRWQYGGFIDIGYLLDFDHPANRVFRSRGTT